MSIPEFLEPLFTAQEMQGADSFAIQTAGVPSLDLMERAGAGLARVVESVAPQGAVAFVIGRGNNGGDGLVAARHLRQAGREVEVLSLYPLDKLSEDSDANLGLLSGDSPRVCGTDIGPELLTGYTAVVDCVLGTGFSGTPRQPAAQAISAINDTPCSVIACDVPSGVDASSGEVEAQAVEADATATFHASKIGLHVAPGAFYAGDVCVVPIGIPQNAPTADSVGLITGRVFEAIPRRGRWMSKFDAGTLLIVGGARGLTGAPCMTAMSAVRTGAGYVQLVVPRSLEAVFETRLLEPMTRGATDSDGSHLPETVSLVSEMAERAHALVLGPGLGRAEGALELARLVARDVQRPLVIDADGLNAHIGHLETLAMRRQATVLTPHAGELGRLLAQDASDVQKHRLSAAREAARRSGATVVLKGDDSLVASPSGSVAVSPGGSPALATAGTGDVLSGMIGTLLAKGLDAPRAASAAVLAHAQAGQLAARAQGASHTSAADVIDAIAPSFSDGAKSK